MPPSDATFLYFDDSKHPGEGFYMVGLACMSEEPTQVLQDLLKKCGVDPNTNEFKSSAHMDRHPEQRRARAALKYFLMDRGVHIGVAVASAESELGPAALELLRKALGHSSQSCPSRCVYFDEGFFPRPSDRERAVKATQDLGVNLRFEQRSHEVPGIQVADLIAHTCSILLREEMGTVNKRLQVGPESLYDPDTVLPLGFQPWSLLRYLFLSEAPSIHPDEIESGWQPIADVSPYGLYITPTVASDIRVAAEKRFGSMYLGCIH